MKEVQPPMKPRRLKVSATQPDTRCTHPPFPVLSPMPFLRLRGRWLEPAGFGIGTTVQVMVSAGRLVLEVVEPGQAQS